MIENYFVPELSNKVGNNFDEQIFMQAHPLMQLKNYRIIEKIFWRKNYQQYIIRNVAPIPRLEPLSLLFVALFEREFFSENIGNVSFLKRRNETILRQNF